MSITVLPLNQHYPPLDQPSLQIMNPAATRSYHNTNIKSSHYYLILEAVYPSSHLITVVELNELLNDALFSLHGLVGASKYLFNIIQYDAADNRAIISLSDSSSYIPFRGACMLFSNADAVYLHITKHSQWLTGLK
jgi:RNase P/RNase MRP subunit POP5